ncbi:unnamed protein product [Paramecium pentaurelia]|uniref:Uncharacterized protein n=1 Tax=Paramecium pentaurelia TaxID=43138 RepID=A0A8S1Y968_9CILI|nr:unnamed protein product [Paramecium pentaurelia]
MSQSTQFMNEVVIESLKCSFSQCNSPLIPSNKNFIYYYYKQNPIVHNTNGQIINGINDVRPLEIKFVCYDCINNLKENGRQYIIQIEEKINLNREQYSISVERDCEETPKPPKQGSFTTQRQFCQKCIQNQNQIKSFDISIQSQNRSSIDTDIEIAKYYAEEQYQKDKEIFEQLQQRLQRINNNDNEKMTKLMILNKIKMIMKKYE